MKSFKKLMLQKDFPKRWFVTGGAGFIGSHLVDLLVSAGLQVTVYDNLNNSTTQYLSSYIKNGAITFHKKDIMDFKSLVKCMRDHDIVCHFAANTDIAAGFVNRQLDLENDLLGTCNVLEAMVKNKINKILFASTGAVYGESIRGVFKETSGPLVPISLYGAAKLSCEAFIGAYSDLFEIKSWIFRFGNVLGDRINHGIIYDFISKLKKNPRHLQILGKGNGKKNYFLVEECLHGILSVFDKTPKGPFPIIINLGTDSTTKIMNIARIVISEMGLSNVKFNFTGTERGWPGDQPVVLLDTTYVLRLGWSATRSSNEAVSIATRRLLGKEKLELSVETLIK